MKTEDYEKAARSTAMYYGIGTWDGVLYNSLKLAGEAGEVADKVGKIVGKNRRELTGEQKEELKKELGDTLWHLTNLGLDLGLSLEDIMLKNNEKLADRYKRDVIMDGDGDNR